MISPQDRRKAVELVNEAVAQGVRIVRACECLGIAFSTYLKWSKSPEDEDGRSDPQRSHSPLALTEEEKQAVIERFCQPDMCDLSIRQAFHRLLDKGESLASESTVYRIFREHGVNIRRDGAREPIKRHKPTSFEATGLIRSGRGTSPALKMPIINSVFTTCLRSWTSTVDTSSMLTFSIRRVLKML